VGVVREGVGGAFPRHRHLQLAVPRAIDGANAAATDERLDLELAVREAPADEVGRAGGRALSSFEIRGVSVRELVVRRVSGAERGRSFGRSSEERCGLGLANAQLEREALGRRRSDGIREEPERLGRSGRVDLERVSGPIDGCRQQRHIGDLSGERDAFQEGPRRVVRQIRHKHGERAVRCN